MRCGEALIKNKRWTTNPHPPSCEDVVDDDDDVAVVVVVLPVFI